MYSTRAPMNYMKAVYEDGAACPRFEPCETPMDAKEWLYEKSQYVRVYDLEGNPVMVYQRDVEKFEQWKKYMRGDYSFVRNKYSGELYHVEQQLKELNIYPPEDMLSHAAKLYQQASKNYAEGVKKEQERAQLLEKREELIDKASEYEREELERMYGKAAIND